MRKHILLVLLFLFAITIFGQIDMNDSTVQVIGYWDINEKQTYTISEEKYKIKGSDTTDREFFKYNVDITIIDSTADSYIINWFYYDYDVKSDNDFMIKMATLVEDMTVTIKTDEFGAFVEVVNWKEIRKFIHKAVKMAKKEVKGYPNINKIFNQIEGTFSSKEAITAVAIREIQQYHTFHGAQYKLGEELNATMKVANLIGGKPFDNDVTLILDEINTEENYYVIRMWQEVNSEQLTKATFDYVTEMFLNLKAPVPKWEDYPPLTNETYTGSLIHGTGWVMYSIETKEVVADSTMSFSERIIDLQ